MTNTNPHWPFDSPPNVACITVRAIVDSGSPILVAVRDADDGGWHFLTGSDVTEADAMIVSLRSMVDRDPTLLHLADIQPGGSAVRDSRTAPWTVQITDDK